MTLPQPARLPHPSLHRSRSLPTPPTLTRLGQTPPRCRRYSPSSPRLPPPPPPPRPRLRSRVSICVGCIDRSKISFHLCPVGTILLQLLPQSLLFLLRHLLLLLLRVAVFGGKGWGGAGDGRSYSTTSVIQTWEGSREGRHTTKLPRSSPLRGGERGGGGGRAEGEGRGRGRRGERAGGGRAGERREGSSRFAIFSVSTLLSQIISLLI